MLRRLLVLLVTATAVFGCGSGPSGPTPPPPPAAPAISCPANQLAEVDLAPAAVTYPQPTVTGGSTPVTQQCSIASGGMFPNGTSSVTCTATDTTQRTAQCSFSVTVSVVPKLLGTRFLAFGDSITWGETAATVAPSSNVLDFDPVNNYPVVLSGLLQQRYKKQTIDMRPRGLQGESVFAGEQRLVDEIALLQPVDALLLMEGYNDNNQMVSPNQIVNSLRLDVIRAKQRGVKRIFLSTLVPQSICTVPPCRNSNPTGVDAINAGIRDVAVQQGVVLVDNWAAFNPVKPLVIGVDGLHPTILGYQLMAETFMAAIVANFEEPPPAAPAQLLARRR